MAFKDAKIGFFPSSTGHGGIVTIYSAVDDRNTLRSDAFFATKPPADTNENLTARRTYEALVDFCEAQSADNTPNGEWVVCHCIGNDGGGAANRIYADDGFVKQAQAG